MRNFFTILLLFYSFSQFEANGISIPNQIKTKSKNLIAAEEKKEIIHIIQQIQENGGPYIYLTFDQDFPSLLPPQSYPKNKDYINIKITEEEHGKFVIQLEQSPEVFSEFDIGHINTEFVKMLAANKFTHAMALLFDEIITKYKLPVDNSLLFWKRPLWLNPTLSTKRLFILPITILFLILFPFFYKVTKFNSLAKIFYHSFVSVLLFYIGFGDFLPILGLAMIIGFLSGWLGFNRIVSFFILSVSFRNKIQTSKNWYKNHPFFRGSSASGDY